MYFHWSVILSSRSLNCLAGLHNYLTPHTHIRASPNPSHTIACPFFLSLFIFPIGHSKQSIRQREVPSFLFFLSLYIDNRDSSFLSLSCSFSPGKRFTHSIFLFFFCLHERISPELHVLHYFFRLPIPPSQVEHFRIAPFFLPFPLRFKNLSFCALYVPVAVSPISASTLFSFLFWYLQSLQLKLPQ